MYAKLVDLDLLCPHCGQRLRLREEGHLPTGAEEVVWTDYRALCPSGCRLTVADFMDHDGNIPPRLVP